MLVILEFLFFNSQWVIPMVEITGKEKTWIFFLPTGKQ